MFSISFKKLIWKFEFPAVTAEHKFACYKIAHRSDNAHAYVNAAFLAKVKKTQE